MQIKHPIKLLLWCGPFSWLWQKETLSKRPNRRNRHRHHPPLHAKREFLGCFVPLLAIAQKQGFVVEEVVAVVIWPQGIRA